VHDCAVVDIFLSWEPACDEEDTVSVEKDFKDVGSADSNERHFCGKGAREECQHNVQRGEQKLHERKALFGQTEIIGHVHFEDVVGNGAAGLSECSVGKPCQSVAVRQHVAENCECLSKPWLNLLLFLFRVGDVILFHYFRAFGFFCGFGSFRPVDGRLLFFLGRMLLISWYLWDEQEDINRSCKLESRPRKHKAAQSQQGSTLVTHREPPVEVPRTKLRRA
jgi:hypothetical protein